jgi:formate dehydrogenase assembly factor FdhD
MKAKLKTRTVDEIQAKLFEMQEIERWVKDILATKTGMKQIEDLQVTLWPSLCKFCTDYRGSPKPIMPDDLLARREKDWSYRCGVCVQEDIDNAIVRVNPTSEKAQAILKRRQREEAIDKLNKELYQRSKAKR